MGPGPCSVVSFPPTSTPSASDSPGPIKVPRTRARARRRPILPRTSRASSLSSPTSSSISPLTGGPTISLTSVVPTSPAEQPPSTSDTLQNPSREGGFNQYGHVTPHCLPTSLHAPTLPHISNISPSDNHQRGDFRSQTSISASQLPPSLYYGPGYQANAIDPSWNSNSFPPRFSSGSNQHSWGASLQYTHPTYLGMTPALPTSNNTPMLCQARNSYHARQRSIDGIQYSHPTSQVNHRGQQKMADGMKSLPIFVEGPQLISKSLIHPPTQENYATPHRRQPIPEPPIHNFSYRAGYARFHELQPISKPPTYTFAQENCRDVGDYAHGPQPSPTSEYSESSTCIPAQGHYAYDQTIPEYDSSSFLDAPPSIPGLPKFWPTRFNPESHPLL
ncbi:hypothetical protein BD779DRAFT_1679706 [Infundibulicybe gibba]|nr:hypothetical protein BD779DRAFT_1679706 [Infundibulicybe gibba]